ncbi:MAG: glycoside hydrolase family 3 N-terminal domain-containing protein [Acidobacteriota bacterium]|nr:glycoside hydrolase family 3 N-terminal domain-containing protein [Acidobacteriota bacterium]
MTSRFVFGLAGPTLLDSERALLAALRPLGIFLSKQNLLSASQAASLLEALRGSFVPAPLLFLSQEGGSEDPLGPLLGTPSSSAAACAAAGTDRVHESAYLMGRAARLLGFDVDLAPVLDLGQPGTGAVVLEGRCFGFHAEDVVLSGMMFLHGLARAGLAAGVKHFPGLGRAGTDTRVSRPVIDAHDVDLMVTDVAPFTKLARGAECVVVGHGAYPGFTGDDTPASVSPKLLGVLRGPVRFEGVSLADDLVKGALDGTLPERAERAARAGCDALIVSGRSDSWQECAARVAELGDDAARDARFAALRRRVADAPRPQFTEEAWTALAKEASDFAELMSKPREKRKDPLFPF